MWDIDSQFFQNGTVASLRFHLAAQNPRKRLCHLNVNKGTDERSLSGKFDHNIALRTPCEQPLLFAGALHKHAKAFPHKRLIALFGDALL